MMTAAEGNPLLDLILGKMLSTIIYLAVATMVILLVSVGLRMALKWIAGRMFGPREQHDIATASALLEAADLQSESADANAEATTGTEGDSFTPKADAVTEYPAISDSSKHYVCAQCGEFTKLQVPPAKGKPVYCNACCTKTGDKKD